MTCVLVAASPPIYLNWIFPILQFEILSLMNWIFSQFRNGILSSLMNWIISLYQTGILYQADKSSSNWEKSPVHQNRYFKLENWKIYLSADR